MCVKIRHVVLGQLFITVGAVFVQFVIDGLLRTYGLLYLELLDKYNQGPQGTGVVATVFAVFLSATCKWISL